MRRTTARTASLWLCALLAACASSAPVTLDTRYRPVAQRDPQPALGARPKAVPVAAAPAACAFHVASFEDKRPSGATLGHIAGRAVFLDDIQAWVRSGLATLPGYADAPTPASIGLEVELVKAYLQSLTTAKTATVVMRVAYPGAAAAPVQYRGTNTSVNWNSSDSEAREAMNLALGDVLARMRTDLGKHCPVVATDS